MIIWVGLLEHIAHLFCPGDYLRLQRDLQTIQALEIQCYVPWLWTKLIGISYGKSCEENKIKWQFNGPPFTHCWLVEPEGEVHKGWDSSFKLINMSKLSSKFKASTYNPWRKVSTITFRWVHYFTTYLSPSTTFISLLTIFDLHTKPCVTSCHQNMIQCWMSTAPPPMVRPLYPVLLVVEVRGIINQFFNEYTLIDL